MTNKVYLALDNETYEWLQTQRDVDQSGIKVRVSLSVVIKGCIRSVMEGSD